MAYAKASRKQDNPFLWDFPAFCYFFLYFANLQLTPVSFLSFSILCLITRVSTPSMLDNNILSNIIFFRRRVINE